jgi:hypothetical protein
MNSAVWWLSGFVILGMSVLLVLTFVPFFARYSAYQLVVRLGIGLPARLEAPVSARLMVRDRGAATGAVVSAVAAIVAFELRIITTDSPALSGVIVVGLVVAGGCVGSTVSAFTRIPDVAPDATRIARSGAVDVSDYVRPAERGAARALVLVSVVVVAVTALTGAGEALLPGAAFAAFGAIALALFELASRRIVSLPQRAASTADLVWADAIRASTLRDMLLAPVVLGGYGVIFGAVRLVESSLGSTLISTAELSGIATTSTLVAMSLYERVSGSQRHFLGRLWPDLRWRDTADTDDTVDVATHRA